MTVTPQNSHDVAAIVKARTYDPLPDSPQTEVADQTWYALPGQWELGLLHRLVREGFAAACDVEFAANYGALQSSARFRIAGTAGNLLIRTTGRITRTEGATIKLGTGGLAAVEPAATGVWTLGLEAGPGVPAGFTVIEGSPVFVEAIDSAVGLVPAGTALGATSTPPHEIRNPIHELRMTKEGALWVLPAEVLGRVVITSDKKPRIFGGESREEAAAGHSEEQHHEVQLRADGRWESTYELGLRYLSVRDTTATEVLVQARSYPVNRRGSFACSDQRLTDIWVTSAYTLRQCAQGMIVDGIKRDRMPWMGDLALGVLGFAHAFGDPKIIERGLVALGQNRSGYINGIVDYSLWWLICTASYARYFDATEYLRAHADHIHAFTAKLADEADDRGVLRPHPGDDAYAKPVFIDWQVQVDPERDNSALQLLWYWALDSAASVLRVTGHPGAGTWETLAKRLRATLFDTAWDHSSKSWREYLDSSPSDFPYPNLFALASGIMGGTDTSGVSQVLRDGPRTRTPFITAFALDALARSGNQGAAVEAIRALWGSMLDAGATTFWEEFHEDGAGAYEMYGRPFGKSLCHAWAGGPAQLLPEIVCGIRPVGPGWSTFEVRPHLGDLGWAASITPVPGGEITVIATPEQTTVRVPAGHTLLHDRSRYQGPQRVDFDPQSRL
jgi:hypothetical protein